MDLKGLAGGQYKPLSETDIQTLHEAALALLEKTGFTYESGLDDTAGHAGGGRRPGGPRRRPHPLPASVVTGADPQGAAAGSSFTAAPARTTWS